MCTKQERARKREDISFGTLVMFHVIKIDIEQRQTGEKKKMRGANAVAVASAET